MKHLIDLELNECRWPVGETLGAPEMFCAAPKAGAGCPYCERHRKMAYVAAPRDMPPPMDAPLFAQHVILEFDEVRG